MTDHHLFFGGERLEFDHRKVAALSEVPRLVEHIGDAAGHAGGEIAAGLADDDDDSAGHVFAAVVAYALDNRDGAASCSRRTVRRPRRGSSFSCDRAVKHGVADDDRLLWLQLLRLCGG